MMILFFEKPKCNCFKIFIISYLGISQTYFIETTGMSCKVMAFRWDKM